MERSSVKVPCESEDGPVKENVLDFETLGGEILVQFQLPMSVPGNKCNWFRIKPPDTENDF